MFETIIAVILAAGGVIVLIATTPIGLPILFVAARAWGEISYRARVAWARVRGSRRPERDHRNLFL